MPSSQLSQSSSAHLCEGTGQTAGKSHHRYSPQRPQSAIAARCSGAKKAISQWLPTSRNDVYKWIRPTAEMPYFKRCNTKMRVISYASPDAIATPRVSHHQGCQGRRPHCMQHPRTMMNYEIELETPLNQAAHAAHFTDPIFTFSGLTPTNLSNTCIMYSYVGKNGRSTIHPVV